ncbi:hypothetical protein [Saccharopolyspora phatthalungensis]|uniref:Uncharacterized protein n=1 Tax=Saccharopolyspora phatthalungensis TaxID=664693 RepID=A0A840Q0I6_9PSEU|nr:hypothetical protein [Saccharopolyspora phatthalungensis]MBB5154046.1 hypothetical protein [Saccharopolyspora phatthalungensis]
MRTWSWSRALHALVDYVRRMNELSDRHLLAWPPKPAPLHWVRRDDTWILHGEVLPPPARDTD